MPEGRFWRRRRCTWLPVRSRIDAGLLTRAGGGGEGGRRCPIICRATPTGIRRGLTGYFADITLHGTDHWVAQQHLPAALRVVHELHIDQVWSGRSRRRWGGGGGAVGAMVEEGCGGAGGAGQRSGGPGAEAWLRIVVGLPGAGPGASGCLRWRKSSATICAGPDGGQWVVYLGGGAPGPEVVALAADQVTGRRRRQQAERLADFDPAGDFGGAGGG